jgi:hypothetical protein
VRDKKGNECVPMTPQEFVGLAARHGDIGDSTFANITNERVEKGQDA